MMVNPLYRDSFFFEQKYIFFVHVNVKYEKKLYKRQKYKDEEKFYNKLSAFSLLEAFHTLYL